MALVHRYPVYGYGMRPGTGCTTIAGWSYGHFRGFGDGADTVAAAPDTIPMTPKTELYAGQLERQAQQMHVTGNALLALGRTTEARAAFAAADALQKQAIAARAGHGLPAGMAEHPGQGKGIPERVREWWVARTPGQKAATVAGGGLGLAWVLGVL